MRKLISILILVNTVLFGCTYNSEEIYRNEIGCKRTQIFYPGSNRLMLVGGYDKDSLECGEHLLYYENGQLRARSTFLNGKPHGEFRSYYENGTPKEYMQSKEGFIYGEYKGWYENGRLKRQGTKFVDSLGYEIKFDIDGKVVEANRGLEIEIKREKQLITLEASLTPKLPIGYSLGEFIYTIVDTVEYNFIYSNLRFENGILKIDLDTINEEYLMISAWSELIPKNKKWSIQSINSANYLIQKNSTKE